MTNWPDVVPDVTDLVTVADYQAVTFDTTSMSPAVTGALNEALSLAQDETGRQLLRGTYTEILKLYRDGRVYPSATPIVSVSVPTTDPATIQGAGIYVGSAPIMALGWRAGIPPQTTVTYIGGYTAETCPAKLRRAICRIAYNSLHPAVLTGVPAGVNSVHVGDVGYSAAGGESLRTMDPLDDGICSDLSRFRNPRFTGWSTLVSGPT